MIDEKLLIIHMDDIGMSYASNMAAIQLFEKGIVTSASVMMPCPWAFDFIKWLKDNPKYDVGVHLTHTCEWDACRWKPLNSIEKVPHLLDGDGFMWRGFNNELKSVPKHEIELEIYAQINLARKWGLDFSHIDTHMWVVGATPDFFRIYLEAANKYHVMANIPQWALWDDERKTIFNNSHFPMVDAGISSGEGKDYETKKADLINNLRNIKPGLNVLTIHPVIETPEIKAIIPSWKDRLLEFQLFMDNDIMDVMDEIGIKLIAWRDILHKK